ncbi:hypothetical protein [Defluviitalea phaphyphila]|uniref:hypothetical protein n=1 Tax=Defluviitalea phaphyphila TaxID=1473580 RepID=UPI0007319E37|nr:hypothetical protein [Defluviitalea phaphyphila]
MKRKFLKMGTIMIFLIVLLTSCENKDSQLKNQELEIKNNEEVEENRIITEDIAKDNFKWDMGELKAILNIPDDMEILFQQYYDFDGNMIDELIIAYGYKNEKDKNYVKDIYYVGANEGEYKIYYHLEPSGYRCFSVELIYLLDRDQPVLYCRNTNDANLVGFELYEVCNNSLNQLVYSASGTGVGNDEMLDLDGDGIYTGYVQKRQSYDYLYTHVNRYFSYIDGKFVLENISVDFFDYPSTPEAVVLEYLNMHSIINKEEIDIPDIESRLEELCPKKFKPPYLYNYEDMIEFNITLESPFMLRTENFDDSNIAYVYQENQLDESIPTVVYVLKKHEEKWQIYDYRLIDRKKSDN